MARLSRTAKFADLREQMSNDRESAVYTEELGRYEDKLRGIQNNVYGTNENILRRDNVNVAPVYGVPNGVYGQVNYGGQPMNNPYVQPQVNPYAQPQVNPYAQQPQQPQAPVYTAPVQQAPVYQQPPQQYAEPQPQQVYVEPQPVQVEPQPVYVEPQPVQVEPQPQVAQEPVYNEPGPIPQPVNEVPSFEEATKEFKPETGENDFLDFLNSLDTINLDKDIQESIDNAPVHQEPVKPAPVIIEAPKKEPDVIFDNTDDYADIARLIEQDNIDINGVVEPLKEEVKPVINNDFMANAINEVNDYNRNDGRKTIDELSASMVDAIRHPEANDLSSKDDEFSNTVSLEIDKVLSEIKAEPVQVQEEQTPAKEAEPVKEVSAGTIEHPVLTKALEEEVVEIKSMEETLKQDVLDDTIPFVMNEDDESLEEYEDEAPNKILNIILVVLIVILLAILGVIVYYILYAKGIIG